ncbi:hypothetical protein SAMN05421538_11236 [Paracoccus isoporae]|uniref:Uncharacterized protein n=1 Tax=Paracoccus isoporae TaxID=591205 RepID=A0A1G7G3B8_9RHOB|nr:hypothetical protein [Paracoccus isoporae]SDE82587.1 hypothetical protein SAMN05421538_11236 [Paracoccus isoporae]
MDKDIESLAARQREALAEGRAAEKAGQPVIYIHGRPYADPAGEAFASSEDNRPPVKLATQNDGSERLRDIESDNASMMMTLVQSTAENMAFIRKNLSQLAERDCGAVEAAYGRILAEAAADQRHSLYPGKRELDMDL